MIARNITLILWTMTTNTKQNLFRAKNRIQLIKPIEEKLKKERNMEYNWKLQFLKSSFVTEKLEQTLEAAKLGRLTQYKNKISQHHWWLDQQEAVQVALRKQLSYKQATKWDALNSSTFPKHQFHTNTLLTPVDPHSSSLRSPYALRVSILSLQLTPWLPESILHRERTSSSTNNSGPLYRPSRLAKYDQTALLRISLLSQTLPIMNILSNQCMSFIHGWHNFS